MSILDWPMVPLTLVTDLRHGGRWVSLRSPAREWLWTNPAEGIAESRAAVAPGDSFVDAGGVEECLPTIRGVPDHGDAWSRPWAGEPASVAVPGFGRLHRRATGTAPLRIDYDLSGTPGTAFLHAVHALLDLTPSARLLAPGATTMLVLDPAPSWSTWPAGLDRLGPDDGTAVCALLPGCREATVVDGDESLTFQWSAESGDDLSSLVVWRNLGGWPDHSPYRSIGVEPMVGRAADLATATPGDCPRIGPDGHYRWHLSITAHVRPSPSPRLW